MFDWVHGLVGTELALDLGTASCSLLARGRKVLCNEPSVVAIARQRSRRAEVLAVGREALDYARRCPSHTRVLRPYSAGRIEDHELFRVLLEHVFRVGARARPRRARVAVCVPARMEPSDRWSVCEGLCAIGAREVSLIDASVAAYFGHVAPRPVSARRMSALMVQRLPGKRAAARCGSGVEALAGSDARLSEFIVDMGESGCAIAVLKQRRIVARQWLAIGGAELDRRVAAAIRDRHQLLVGATVAERVKIEVGCGYKAPRAAVEATGRRDGQLTLVDIDVPHIQGKIRAALAPLVAEIRLQSELWARPGDEEGIGTPRVLLTGAAAQLRDLASFVASECRLEVSVADEPEFAALLGCERAQTEPELLASIADR